MRSLFQLFATRLVGFGSAKDCTNADGGTHFEESEPDKPYDLP
jgi:hypothetical protein